MGTFLLVMIMEMVYKILHMNFGLFCFICVPSHFQIIYILQYLLRARELVSLFLHYYVSSHTLLIHPFPCCYGNQVVKVIPYRITLTYDTVSLVRPKSN